MKDEVTSLFRSILVVEDHPLYGEAIATTIGMNFPGACTRLTTDLAGALQAVAEGPRPDLILLDQKLPDVCGLKGFETLHAKVPDVPIVVISAETSGAEAARLIEAGAAGFLDKAASSDLLIEALHDVAAGGVYSGSAASRRPGRPSDREKARARLADLTPQQKRILKMICAGKANKQIAYEMDLAEATVKAHITALLRRIGVMNRVQAAVLAEQAQFTEMDAG